MHQEPNFATITTFIFDIDGVLTDGTVLVMENGVQARRMSIKDGFALQLAVKKGYRIIIISGSAPSPVIDRLAKLGITDVNMEVLDKKSFISSLMNQHGIKIEEVLFMGDDLPDLPAMSVVGLPACPSDAADEIREVVKYVSPRKGGCGCVRDVIERVMKHKGDWEFHPDVASR
ncbi:MAG: HAD hydrolase family protein [Chitinophagaceae bacterium]|nr:HAD hydrolase family protein [Chitinophagaceae bacterium]